MDRPAIYSFMTQFKYGVISSAGLNGTPQSALVGIAVSRDLEIVFDTVKSSRKYHNLRKQPACSFVVGWGGEQTIQYEGIASEPDAAHLKHYQEVYFATWPDGRSRMNWTGIAYFVIRPIWIRYCDYGQPSPVVEELTRNPVTDWTETTVPKPPDDGTVSPASLAIAECWPRCS